MQVQVPDLGMPEVLEGLLLSEFLVGVLSEWNSDVGDARSKRRIIEPSFKGGLGINGMLAAFRGRGHDRLVSRRWLEHGPWALLRHEPTDVSIVLHRDPEEEDVDTILAQTGPAHQRIGWTPDGGYLPPKYRGAGFDLAGTYLIEERRHIVLVIGRTVSEEEMLAACAFRRDSRGTDKPIDTMSFVFMDEEAARAHLHELWLRELECRCVIAGAEVRLDTDYAPEPKRPAWAQPVEAKWQQALSAEAIRLGLQP